MDLELVRIRKNVFNFLSPKSYAVKDAQSSPAACSLSVAGIPTEIADLSMEFALITKHIDWNLPWTECLVAIDKGRNIK